MPMTVKIAKTRNGSFFPSLLTPRRRIDVALPAVVLRAEVHGRPTRKVVGRVVALAAGLRRGAGPGGAAYGRPPAPPERGPRRC